MKIGFIGAGNMGQAIIKGIIEKNIVKPSNLFVFTRSLEKIKDFQSELNFNFCHSKQELLDNVECIILAVKPKDIPNILKEIGKEVKAKKITLVSIAAGLTINTLNEMMQEREIPIIRIMPNINAKISMSTTAYCNNEYVDSTVLEKIKLVFSTIGSLFFIEEDKFSVFSAIAGCAPAFVYLFAEGLAKGAVKEGLSKTEALQIIADMIKGSAKTLEENNNLNPHNLIDNVCSPAGTTIEGICTLEEEGLTQALIKAVSNCVNKDKQINKKSF